MPDKQKYEASNRMKQRIIGALKDNIGDWFYASEILEAVADQEISSANQVGGFLSGMLDLGLVERRRDNNKHAWCLKPEALAWQPEPYPPSRWPSEQRLTERRVG